MLQKPCGAKQHGHVAAGMSMSTQAQCGCSSLAAPSPSSIAMWLRDREQAPFESLIEAEMISLGNESSINH